MLLVNHPGSLVLILSPWSVEMPLWLAVLGLVLAFFLFYVVLRIINGIHFSWYRWQYWWRTRRKYKAHSKTQRGLLALIEEQWAYAEKQFLDGVPQSDELLINYLGAAKAAHEQAAYARRDSYLQKSHLVAPNAEVPIGLVQVEFQIQQNQLEQALATLNHLRRLAPKNPHVLRLLKRVYLRLSDWKALLDILPNLCKAKILTKDQEDLFEKNMYVELFRSAKEGTYASIANIWQQVPRRLQKNPEVIAAYVTQLLRFAQCGGEAEELVRKALKNEWNAELVSLYGSIKSATPAKQLAVAETWLKRYGQRPALLFLLGKLSMRCQLWGKARDYYEQGLAQETNSEASLEYGQLLEKLGESKTAVDVYRQGIHVVRVEPKK